MKFERAYKLKEIAKLIKAKSSGNPEHKITGINEIHVVTAGDITFVDHPKYYAQALNSKATTIIIDKKVDCPKGKALLFSDDPFRDYNNIIKNFVKFKKHEKQISKTAKIGKNTIIEPNVFLGNNVKIGSNCIIHPNVCIYDNVVIGNNVILHSGVVIGADAFYYKRRPKNYDKLLSCGSVIIEDDVEIGANSTIDRGVSANTVIGKGTKIDNLVQIGHDTIIGKNCILASQVGIAGVATIEDNVILWGQVGVSKDLTIGKGAVVYAKSGVHKSLKPNTNYFGIPVKEAEEKMKELIYIGRLPKLFEKK
ncbi:MAG: UDP-3-O-(3-hydroxymyristoyl)glucosamine N-acyltransferase [Bacteroidales bacterium]|nr:UDP-3-O-(3-hydroxymyristoyl)glucosamine N-acyltransferase [Bacteroidales bacterium]